MRSLTLVAQTKNVASIIPKETAPLRFTWQSRHKKGTSAKSEMNQSSPNTWAKDNSMAEPAAQRKLTERSAL